MTMARLTRKDGEIIKINYEFESLSEAVSLLSLALYVREEEAEKREQGCEFCKDIAPDVCGLDTLHISYADVIGDEHQLDDVQVKYCFNCGRKLVE